MAITGLFLHMLFASLCVAHIVRYHRPLPWVPTVLCLPVVGVLAYVICFRRLAGRARRVYPGTCSAPVSDPDTAAVLRAAQIACHASDSPANQTRYADALLEAGHAEEAALRYEGVLAGSDGTNPDLRFCAARAYLQARRFADAVFHLQELQQASPSFHPEAVILLTARALAGCSRFAEAHAEFNNAVQRFGTYQSRAEYAIWAAEVGDTQLAATLLSDLGGRDRAPDTDAGPANAADAPPTGTANDARGAKP